MRGGEGSGKTSLTPHLVEFLREQGHIVFAMREPGGTIISEEIREIIKTLGDEKMNKTTRALLFQAARAQIVEEVVKPRLDLGQIVICDRYFDSTFAYQGYGDGLDLRFLDSLTKVVTQGIIPDITVLFDVEAEIGLSRRKKAGGIDGFDAMPLEYHQRINAAYRMMAREERGRWLVINANAEIDEVKQELLRSVVNRLAMRGNIEGGKRSAER